MAVLLVCLIICCVMHYVNSASSCNGQECTEWSNQIPYIEISELREAYDFIVIGAGASGSVLATRLALDPSHPNVLLLEAGNKANTSSLSFEMLPPMSFENQLTEIDWSFKTVPQKTCCQGLLNRQCLWPRGKVMGGSTVLNTMFWVYGNPNDWDQIFKIDGWSSKDVLPYFHKIENYHSYPYNEAYQGNRGKNGPIEINEVRNLLNADTAMLTNKFIAACVDSGYLFIDDINDWEANNDDIGCHYAQNNIEYQAGTRINAFVGYMKYLINSPDFQQQNVNLDILSNAFVTKINVAKKDKFNKDKHVATGVEFIYDNNKDRKYFIGLQSVERGEIIISAGTINTPHLLILSGFGPENELKRHNIDIIEAIPAVGQDLQDHIFVPITFHLKAEYFDKVITLNSIGENLKTSGLEANVFIQTNITKERYGEDTKWPDVKFHFVRLGGLAMSGRYFNYIESEGMNLLRCGDKKYYEDVNNIQAFMASIILEHPESRGEIKLFSSDPFQHPMIDPKYLSADYDVNVLKEGYKLYVELFDNMKDVWDERIKCDMFGDIDIDDKALEQWIRAIVVTQWHAVGTCKMGNDVDDESVVVDKELRLKKTVNIRIADASILPNVVSGNTQSACYMIGERAATFILKKWNLNSPV